MGEFGCEVQIRPIRQGSDEEGSHWSGGRAHSPPGERNHGCQNRENQRKPDGQLQSHDESPEPERLHIRKLVDSGCGSRGARDRARNPAQRGLHANRHKGNARSCREHRLKNRAAARDSGRGIGLFRPVGQPDFPALGERRPSLVRGRDPLLHRHAARGIRRFLEGVENSEVLRRFRGPVGNRRSQKRPLGGRHDLCGERAERNRLFRSDFHDCEQKGQAVIFFQHKENIVQSGIVVNRQQFHYN